MHPIKYLLLLAGAAISLPSQAVPVYWNVFNIEGESSIGADLVTYDSLTDMLTDINRTSVNTLSGVGANVVGGGSDGTNFWNVFNIEGESRIGADIVTYGSLMDMLTDTNRASVNTLGGFGANIVGSGSDGSSYWNVFNIEGESAIGADIVTYGSLADMLLDTNRTSVNTLGGFGANIVGSGSDGTSYWNVFNIEGESDIGADIVTYGSLADMLTDVNRTSVSTLTGFGANIVGSGAFNFDKGIQVSEPAHWGMLLFGLFGLYLRRRSSNGVRLKIVLSGIPTTCPDAPGVHRR
ncbi:PEP-CTERM protein-sorting domain-containing protein [Marinobacter daqiaonensis]|uniref:PEP-CTERM protein-sorting domain-containing protein n=2 Tax=Marinobacter daqiaonensis TaxID=650891 RepID=A0A1I6GZP2_9GAMM|nr:PEP-CTERM sorting domain-containing protein [Marinobacter daqiaonensis]SFR47649.1 PEP-CTERM protein-sorting domain-containing protein [Marinobacter daqiaonensis]